MKAQLLGKSALIPLLSCFLFQGLLAEQSNAFDDVDASRCHILIVADTEDEQIGQLCHLDGKRLYNTLRDEIPRIRRGDIRILKGKAATKKEIVSLYESLEVKPTESIFFYFTGHGAQVRGGDHVLKMADGELFKRTELRDLLRAKEARLTVMITDSCSNTIPEQPSYAMAPRMMGIIDYDVCRFLFFRHAGFVDINSATPPQEAVMVEKRGSFFTYALCNLLSGSNDMVSDRSGRVTWQSFSDVLTERTASQFEMYYENNEDFAALFGDQKTQTPKVYGKMAQSLSSSLPKVAWRLGVKVSETGGNGVRIDEVFGNSQAEWAGFVSGEILYKVEKVWYAWNEQTKRLERNTEPVTIRTASEFMNIMWGNRNDSVPLLQGVYVFYLRNNDTGKERVIRARIRSADVRKSPGR